jgi:hypothetical protein
LAAKGRKAGKTQTVKSPGKKPISFKSGGLHQSLGVPKGKPIPPGKMRDALAGKNGPKAKAQADFAKNVLTGPKETPGKTAPRKK